MQLEHHRVGTGTPLVLIHGIGSRWQMWQPVLDRLSAAHEVIALDLPGFGASPPPPADTPPGVPSLVRLVQEFLAQLGVERPHVAGNSLGGLIALELGRRGSARSVTAVSPAGFAGPLALRLGRGQLWLAVRASRALESRADALLATPRARRLALYLFYAHPERIPGDVAAADLRALAGAAWFDATLPVVEPFELDREGQEIPTPVTIAWGERDRLLPARQLIRAGATLPQARLVTLADCGHVPTYDDPEQVARVLLQAAADH